jgi:hypothetical protein
MDARTSQSARMSHHIPNNFRYAVREPEDWCTGPTRSLVMHRPTDAFLGLSSQTAPPRRLP